MTCGRSGTVRNVESRRGLLQFRFYCPRHSGRRQARSRTVEARRAVIRMLLRRKLVVTERYDAGNLDGPVPPRLAVATVAADGVSMHDFAAFLASLRICIEESDLSERVIVRRESAGQAEIKLIESAHATVTWNRLADLIDSV